MLEEPSVIETHKPRANAPQGGWEDHVFCCIITLSLLFHTSKQHCLSSARYVRTYYHKRLCYQLKYPDYKYNMCNIYSDDEFSLVVERVIRLWIEADMNLSSIDAQLRQDV